MFLTIIRIISVLGLLFGVIFGLVVIKKNKLPPFFRCAFFSVICAFMAYLYYLALSTDYELENSFTVGILGEAAQFLFIITANIKFLEKGSFNKKFDLKALLLSLILAIPQIVYVTYVFSIENLICALIYILMVTPCGYICVSNMNDRKNNSFKKATFLYNLFIYLMLLLGSLSQLGLTLTILFESQLMLLLCFGIPCMLSCIFESLSLVVLRKGLISWKE